MIDDYSKFLAREHRAGSRGFTSCMFLISLSPEEQTKPKKQW
jgi:hypothetical protein